MKKNKVEIPEADFSRDNKSIRVSESLMNIANRAVEVRGRLVEQDNKEPALSKIAKELELPVEEVVLALDALQDPVSMFEPVCDDYGDSVYVINQARNKKNSDYSRLPNISMKEAMNNLNLREKLILNLRFFDRRTQMEVAEEIGISKSQVSRLEKNALKNMRKYI